MRRPKRITRLVTHRLSPEDLPLKAEKLADLIAANEMNLCHVAVACRAQPRAVRRWVKVAAERGIDVLELARRKLRDQGVDPGDLPAERIRVGMEEGRAKGMCDRSDTPRSSGRSSVRRLPARKKYEPQPRG